MSRLGAMTCSGSRPRCWTLSCFEAASSRSPWDGRSRGQRLASRGAILIRVDGRYRIRSRTGLLSDAERQRLARTRHSRYGLNTLEAGYLYQALAGPIDRGWDAKGAQAKERYGMGSLLKAGLVEHTGTHVQLTEDAAFSLMASAVRPVPLG